jgi:hypothetical protein
LLIELSSVTIIDANPFFKTHMRRQLVGGKWHLYPTAEGAPLDQLLEENIAAYTRYVEGKMASLKELGTLPPKREVVPQDIPPIKAPIADIQMPLWPSLRATA